MKTKPVLKPLLLALVIAGAFAFTKTPALWKFKVDTEASSLVWVGKKVTGEHTGTISIASGELVAEGKTLKQGSFEIDVNSLTVTDLTDANYNAKLVNHLKGDDFFAATKFPKATFVISSITPASGTDYLVKGKLTIKGKTNDIEFPATITNDGKQVTANAKIKVDRTKFDIRYGSKSFFNDLGDKAISDEFELNLILIANLQ